MLNFKREEPFRESFKTGRYLNNVCYENGIVNYVSYRLLSMFRVILASTLIESNVVNRGIQLGEEIA